MNISKALKIKNRIVGDLKVLRDRFNSNNSYIEKDNSTVDRLSIFAEMNEKQIELTRLKIKIAQATAPIIDKLIGIAELKSELSFFTTLTVQEGTRAVYDYAEDGSQKLVQIPFKSIVTEKDRQDTLKSLQAKIASLQDEIDDFNGMTQI